MSRDRERHRVLRARSRLQRELAGIARTAEGVAPGRCPYRDAGDRCTFRGGCRNRRTGRDPEAPRCGGGRLRP